MDYNKNNKTSALISVYDKTGLAILAQSLKNSGFNLVATAGTGRELAAHNLSFIPANQITHNPDKLTDCIQTISYQASAGILFNRSNKKHLDEIHQLGIRPIDIVVCNFPPINETVQNPTDFNIQHVDLGGPLMVRAAAINYHDVLVVVDPSDYKSVADSINHGQISDDLRLHLAIKAFRYTSMYDQSIIHYLERLPKNTARDLLSS